jgi:hypothetical protein
MLLLAALAAAGCGPDAKQLREQTLSTLNTEADRWDGGQEFATTAADSYGRPLTAKVEKGTLSYTLELRSAGPDGLPKNTDDIVVTRSKRHGETTTAEEAAKGAETIAAGTSSGLVKGIRRASGSAARGRGSNRPRAGLAAQ